MRYTNAVYKDTQSKIIIQYSVGFQRASVKLIKAKMSNMICGLCFESCSELKPMQNESKEINENTEGESMPTKMICSGCQENLNRKRK